MKRIAAVVFLFAAANAASGAQDARVAEYAYRRRMILPRVDVIADRYCQRRSEIEAAQTVDAVAAIFDEIDDMNDARAPQRAWQCTFECGDDRRAYWRVKSELPSPTAQRPDCATTDAPSLARSSELAALDRAARLKTLSPALNEVSQTARISPVTPVDILAGSRYDGASTDFDALAAANARSLAPVPGSREELRPQLEAFRAEIERTIASARESHPSETASLDSRLAELNALAAELDALRPGSDARALKARLDKIKSDTIPYLYCIQNGPEKCATFMNIRPRSAAPPRPVASPRSNTILQDLTDTGHDLVDKGQALLAAIRALPFEHRKSIDITTCEELTAFLPTYAPDLVKENAELLRKIGAATQEKELAPLEQETWKIKRRVMDGLWKYMRAKLSAQSAYEGLAPFLRSYSSLFPAALRAKYERLMKRLPEEPLSRRLSDDASRIFLMGRMSDFWSEDIFQEVRDRILKQTASADGEANDEAAVLAVAKELHEVKQSIMDGVRSMMSRENVGNNPAQRLALLQKRAATSTNGNDDDGARAFDGLAWSPDGQLILQRSSSWTSSEAWSITGVWKRRLERLPMEAELILGTQFPVIYVPRNNDQAIVLPGENYDVRKKWEAAKALQQELIDKAAAADLAEQQAKAALDQAQARLQAAANAKTDRTAALQSALDVARHLDDDLTSATAAEKKAHEDFEAKRGEFNQAAEQASLAQFWHDLIANKTADRDILFDDGKSRLTPAGVEQLKLLAKVLAARAQEIFKTPHQRLKMLIKGHTSHTGSYAFNLQLSKDRARVVKEFLLPLLADAPIDFTTDGVGWNEPVAGIADPKDARHRRVQFQIVDGLGEQAEESSAQAWLQADELRRTRAEEMERLAQAWKDSAQLLAALPDKIDHARADFDQARSALQAAVVELTTSQRSVIASTKALEKSSGASRKARQAVEEQKTVVAREEENTKGVLLVHGSGDDGVQGNRRQIRERIVATLTQSLKDGFGFGQWGTAAWAIQGFFRTTTLADQIAKFEEHFQPHPGNAVSKWFDESGPYTRSLYVYLGLGHQGNAVSGFVAPQAPPKDKAIPVQIVTEKDLKKLFPAPPIAESEQDLTPIPEAKGEPLEGSLRSQEADLPSLSSDPRILTAKHALDQALSSAQQAAKNLGEARQQQGLANDAVRRAQEAVERARRARETLARATQCIVTNACRVTQEAFFDQGSFNVSQEGQSHLQEACQAILQHRDDFSGRTIYVHGYASADGGPHFDNRKLSEQRAVAVARYLSGICAEAPVRFVPVGSGISTARDSAEGNRYVSFEVK